MKLMIDKNLFSLNRFMRACEDAIQFRDSTSVEISGLDDVPRMTENAWMLLLLTGKVEVDIALNDSSMNEWILSSSQRSIQHLIDHPQESHSVNRDKFIILTTMTVVKKFSRDSGIPIFF